MTVGLPAAMLRESLPVVTCAPEHSWRSAYWQIYEYFSRGILHGSVCCLAKNGAHEPEMMENIFD